MSTATISESLDLRKAFSAFPSGVAAISAIVDGMPRGLAASSFTVGVSLEPGLVAFAVQNTSTSWPQLKRASRLGISILGADQEQMCRRLASKDPDKFKDIYYTVTRNGALAFPGSALWMECSLFAEYPAGDHTMVLLEVHDVVNSETEPLVFHESKFKALQ